MYIFLFLLTLKSNQSFKISSLRRNQKIEINKKSFCKSAKISEDSWYFVHLNKFTDYSLISNHGIQIKSNNMINKYWYSLFLTPNQAKFLKKYAILRPVSQNEKIIDSNLIKYSESLQIVTSSSFDYTTDLKSINDDIIQICKHNDHIYQIFSIDIIKLAQYLSYNKKIYSISPKNRTINSNSRAVGFTQHNSQKAFISNNSTDIITIDRVLQKKGLTGEGQIILVQDIYIDPNSTFFYDPNHPVIEKNHYYEDHRKLVVIHDDYDYKPTKANDHGTHAAGCAAGSSHFSNLSVYDGVAPNAKIAFFQSGSSGFYPTIKIEEVIKETHPCVSSSSWGFRVMDIGDENEWNENAKLINDTLFVFSAGNYGDTKNKNLDYYESLTSPGTAKNILTVGAISSIPIDETNDSGEKIIDDNAKSIYFIEISSKQTYKPLTKTWSLKKGDGITNPGVDYLFKEGSVQMKMTKDINEKNLMLIIEDKAGFDAIDKKNPPLCVLTKTDFDVDNFESLGFSHLFPVFFLNGETVEHIYNDYGNLVDVVTNYVSSKMTGIHRAPFSSKGLTPLGLMKPDIVAPGTAIISAMSDPSGGFGHADISIMDGTSIATPNIAGAASLVSQYFIDKKYRSSVSVKPSSTLLRSLLINAAEPLNKSKTSPDADVGFGVLNLGEYILTSVSSNGNDENVLVGDHIEIIGDQHLVAEVDIKDNSRDLRVTISYLDDALNDDSLVALATDLDLVVVSPDQKVYMGNQRSDNSEEMYSTNERIIIKKEDVKPGKYEIHIISRIPEIVPNRRNEFSITVFGSISDSSKEYIEFNKAKTCIPVVEGHGKCNTETTLNECVFNDNEGYTGHSCQNEAIIIVDTCKKLFELDPFDVKYINMFYPLDGEFSNLSITITSATDFLPKYAYSLNSTGLKMPMKEIDADNILSENDLSMTIYNNGKVVEWQAESCLLTMVYNKSPKKTTFIINFVVNIDSNPPITSAPTDKPSESCNCENSNNNKSYFILFIVTSVSCIVMFVIVVIIAVLSCKSSKKENQRSDFLSSDKQLKNPLI